MTKALGWTHGARSVFLWRDDTGWLLDVTDPQLAGHYLARYYEDRAALDAWHEWVSRLRRPIRETGGRLTGG